MNWINPDRADKLTFRWSDGSEFSFDLGGMLRGGKFDGEEFFAEIKNYTTEGDQGTLYREYLAKCYRTYSLLPARSDHFMWLTWHPFSLRRWSSLCEAEEVERAVIEHRAKCLGEPDEARARRATDRDLCVSVAQRLWLIVLSSKQEELVIEEQDLNAVYAQQRHRLRQQL